MSWVLLESSIIQERAGTTWGRLGVPSKNIYYLARVNWRLTAKTWRTTPEAANQRENWICCWPDIDNTGKGLGRY